MNPQSLAKASLLLNLALLGALAYQCYRTPEPSVASARPEPQAPSDPELAPPEPNATTNEAGETSYRAEWSQLESADYPTYMANLRSVGCPEEVIRDIITAKVNKRYQERATAVYSAIRGPFGFWATDDQTQPTPGESADLADQLTYCEGDRRKLLAQLLGVAAGPDQAPPATQQIEWDRRVAFLPPAKQDQLRLLEKQYSGVDEQIHAIVDVRSSIDPEAVPQVMDRYAQRKAALGQLLSPEECEQYELSASWTADNLRAKLAAFAPTVEEFRGIFRLWRAHDEALATIYAQHQPEPGNLYVFDGIKQLLGDERYAQYRQAWLGAPVPPAPQAGSVGDGARPSTP